MYSCHKLHMKQYFVVMFQSQYITYLVYSLFEGSIDIYTLLRHYRNMYPRTTNLRQLIQNRRHENISVLHAKLHLSNPNPLFQCYDNYEIRHTFSFLQKTCLVVLLSFVWSLYKRGVCVKYEHTHQSYNSKRGVNYRKEEVGIFIFHMNIIQCWFSRFEFWEEVVSHHIFLLIYEPYHEQKNPCSDASDMNKLTLF